MADTDILQAIQIIDTKIASLLEARNYLAKAFGIESKSPAQSVNPEAIAAVTRATTQRSAPTPSNGTGHHEPSGRKVELAKFLAANGPASRATIIEQSGLPEGTISYCLNDKRFFQQDSDANWAITDYSRRGLERGSKTGTFLAEAH